MKLNALIIILLSLLTQACQTCHTEQGEEFYRVDLNWLFPSPTMALEGGLQAVDTLLDAHQQKQITADATKEACN